MLRASRRYQRLAANWVRRVFAVQFPDYNGDNWLLTCGAGFVDLSFPRLLA
jgi:hypothetical protein